MVLEKLSKAMAPTLAGGEQVEGGTGEEEEGEEGPPENVHEAASAGVCDCGPFWWCNGSNKVAGGSFGMQLAVSLLVTV